MSFLRSFPGHQNKNIAGNTSVWQTLPFFNSVVQPKLTINEPGDQYEQEADRMADHVMRMPMNNQAFFKPSPLSISTLQRKCKDCEDDEKIHRKENSSQPAEANSETASYINSLSSKGSPLPDSTKSFFEPRFGQDFSGVKIHNDSEAAKSSQAVNAVAYTVGNNIVFNAGQFSPESDGGKRLLAHELTHVVQQGGNQNLSTSFNIPQIFRQECEEFPGGSTDCEVNEQTGTPTGKVKSKVEEANPCTKTCVQQHEDVHVRQFKKYCPELRACYLAADKSKRPLTDCFKMAVFGTNKKECPAYKVSLACIEKRLKTSKDCKSQKNREYGTRKLASEKCFYKKYCGG